MCAVWSCVAVCGLHKSEDCFCPETSLSERFVKSTSIADFSADAMLSCDR